MQIREALLAQTVLDALRKQVPVKDLSGVRIAQVRQTIRSVEAEKVGYDLHCERGHEHVHLEVKGTEGDNVCFIITAAEVRNAMIDRKHLTCVVTTALAATPKMFTLTRDDFDKKIHLAPIAYRARLLAE